MASGSKRRAVGSQAPRPLGASLRRNEEDDEEDLEGDEEDEEDSDDEDAEIVDEVLSINIPCMDVDIIRVLGIKNVGGTIIDGRAEEAALTHIGEVNVEFEAYSISDTDYDGIKKLLQQLFLKAPVNTAELTDLLIQQNHIGSVIKQTDVSEDSDDDVDVDEDEIFGFISLFNLTERKGTQCVEQIKELLLSCCEQSTEQSLQAQLDKVLGDASRPVGLLLSERFLNVPPQIALPMHQQLQKELAEAHATNKPCGKCSFYLLISKTFVEAEKSNSRKKWSHLKKEDLMFANAEEEFFYEKAALTFSYSVQEESDSCLGGRWSFDDVPMKPLRTVMLVPTDRMDEIMEMLRHHLSL